MSLTRPGLSMINPGGSQGDVTSSGRSLKIEQVGTDIATDFAGSFDNTNGIFTLQIPGYPTLRINGFMTQSDIGLGKEGPQGQSGTPGINGIIGEHGNQGQRGCQGPQGPQGERGVRGPAGKQGEQGAQGPQGQEGIPGIDGRVQIYISNEDPGPVGAGALWIKPS